ncbi:arginyl-tRNA synthetase [Marasmius crinis-equi]|uniref:Arginyl-tRNA synthetase n=1 Tax=Marasmius crinis-equi TaxID=585013 RepID=A0ABR3EPW2_9AGAR
MPIFNFKARVGRYENRTSRLSNGSTKRSRYKDEGVGDVGYDGDQLGGIRLRTDDSTFAGNRIESSEGIAGPYLQYTHIRLASTSPNSPHLLPLNRYLSSRLLPIRPRNRPLSRLAPSVVVNALRMHELSTTVAFLARWYRAFETR